MNLEEIGQKISEDVFDGRDAEIVSFRLDDNQLEISFANPKTAAKTVQETVRSINSLSLEGFGRNIAFLDSLKKDTPEGNKLYIDLSEDAKSVLDFLTSPETKWAIKSQQIVQKLNDALDGATISPPKHRLADFKIEVGGFSEKFRLAVEINRVATENSMGSPARSDDHGVFLEHLPIKEYPRLIDILVENKDRLNRAISSEEAFVDMLERKRNGRDDEIIIKW